MTHILPKHLYRWCQIPVDQLEGHPDLRVPFRLVKDSAEMSRVMAQELVQLIQLNNQAGKPTRAIIPCGPSCWYEPFVRLVNSENVSLRTLAVFHMELMFSTGKDKHCLRSILTTFVHSWRITSMAVLIRSLPFLSHNVFGCFRPLSKTFAWHWLSRQSTSPSGVGDRMGTSPTTRPDAILLIKALSRNWPIPRFAFKTTTSTRS